jgi:hypothetical protein
MYAHPFALAVSSQDASVEEAILVDRRIRR